MYIGNEQRSSTDTICARPEGRHQDVRKFVAGCATQVGNPQNVGAGMRTIARAIIFRWTTPLWPVTLAGLLLGAAIGGLALHASSESQSTALLRLYQPIGPDEIMTGTAPSSEAQQSYISGEITYLTSPGFADAVAKQLNETKPPSLSAVQDAQSSIVSLSATQPDPSVADRIINAALKVYTDHVDQQTDERGQAAIDALNGVIGRLEAGAKEAQDPAGGAAAGGTATVTDPQALIQQLLSQRLAIEAQSQRSASVQLVQPPTVTPVEGAPSWSLGAVGGGLVGGIVTLAAALAWRKRVGVITSPESLEGLVEHVLLPTVRLGKTSESSDAYAGLARSLYSQLPTPRSGRILLVGASADSGTEEVAGLIAFAAAEHVGVRLVHLLDRVHMFDMFEGLADLADGATVVIDGGSLDTSPALPRVAQDASQIIIVATIGRDVHDTIRMANRLARESDIPVSAVCTRGRALNARASSRSWRRTWRAEGDFGAEDRLLPQA